MKMKVTREERIGHADSSDPEIFVVRLNKVLNNFWDENELSMGNISMDCGFCRDLIASYIRGGRYPNAYTLAHICNYFNVSADWLLGLSDEKKAVW